MRTPHTVFFSPEEWEQLLEDAKELKVKRGHLIRTSALSHKKLMNDPEYLTTLYRRK